MPAQYLNPKKTCATGLAPSRNFELPTSQRHGNYDVWARSPGRAKRHGAVAVLVLAMFASALLIPFEEAHARVIYLKPEAYAQHLAIKLGTAVFFCTLIVGLIVGSLASGPETEIGAYLLLGVLGAFSAVLGALLYPAQLEEIPEALQLRWDPRDGFWPYSYLYVAYAALGAMLASFLLRLVRQGLKTH